MKTRLPKNATTTLAIRQAIKKSRLSQKVSPQPDHSPIDRTIKFKHPWTNSMIKKFNRTVKEQVLTRYRFCSILEMNSRLIEFVNRYKFKKRLKSLNYKTPAQYLKEQKDIMLQRIVIADDITHSKNPSFLGIGCQGGGQV